MAKLCHYTQFVYIPFLWRDFCALLPVACFLFCLLSQVFQQYPPTAIDVIWRLLVLLYFLSSWLTHSGQLKCFPVFVGFALCLWKPSCLQVATHSFDLQYQIQADAFIIAPKMCVGVVWWFVDLGFFSFSFVPTILLILWMSVSSLTICAALNDHYPPPSSELSFTIANTISNLVISVSLS